MASFVSASASSSTAGALLRRAPRVPRGGLAGAWASPARRPLRAAAAQGSANSAPVMMESKVKKRNKKGGGAGGLPAAIDLEIREAEQYLATDGQEPTPEDFPFEMVDEEGMSVVILKRDYKDEKIEVIVSMPNMEGDPEFDEDDEADGEDAAKDDDDEDEGGEDSSLAMKVIVSKGSGPNLEFTCTAFREEITIDDMMIAEKTEPDAEKFPFEGPEFTELPPNVQKGLFKFLEVRGVTLTTTNFMHDYMITKQTKEYVRWMTKLKGLVQ
ncbi:mitochondrial glycoprotein [Hordeum vulgare]|nr:mitochondrial glycoprotein [Hordeum vulgare]